MAHAQAEALQMALDSVGLALAACVKVCTYSCQAALSMSTASVVLTFMTGCAALIQLYTLASRIVNIIASLVC